MVKSNWCRNFSLDFFSNFAEYEIYWILKLQLFLSGKQLLEYEKHWTFFLSPPVQLLDAVSKNTPGTKEWKLSCITVLLGGFVKGAPLRKLVNETKPAAVWVRGFGRGLGGWMNETLSNIRRFDMVGVCFSWCFLAAKTAGKMLCKRYIVHLCSGITIIYRCTVILWDEMQLIVTTWR